MKKYLRKISAILMTVIMVLTMCVAVFAADSGETPASTGIPSANDKATVKITGLRGNPTVTLYKIASAVYGENQEGLVRYEFVEGADFSNPKYPTSEEITQIANKIIDESITASAVGKPIQVNGSEYSKEVGAGAYIAIITGANDGTVYNPILLTATYNGEGELVPGEILVTDNYLWGSTAVAKSTTPQIDKTVKGPTEESIKKDGDKDTVSVGTELTYTLTPTIPQYPKDAINKTLFATDKMSPGLTFDFSSLEITLKEAPEIVVTKSERVDENGDTLFTIKKDNEDIVIAKAKEKDNGFNMVFVYDNLIYNTANTVGAVYTPIITYKAVVNDNAVVGGDGNKNEAKLIYSNTPNSGETHTTTDTPQNADDYGHKETSKTVYTYQLAIKKVGEGEQANALPGAVFGVYTDKACTNLIDKITTNDEGYAVSTKVAAGTYHIKEISAPSGYTINTKVYDVVASWDTATTITTGTTTTRTYTSTRTDGAVQVGWLKNNVFYAMDTYKNETKAAEDHAVPAYLSKTSSTTSENVTKLENGEKGSGTVLSAETIPNTKTSTLPSTGGIGTYLFTIIGVMIMAAVAGMFLVSRRKERNDQ